jgi:hypothetical protein
MVKKKTIKKKGRIQAFLEDVVHGVEGIVAGVKERVIKRKAKVRRARTK